MPLFIKPNWQVIGWNNRKFMQNMKILIQILLRFCNYTIMWHFAVCASGLLHGFVALSALF